MSYQDYETAFSNRVMERRAKWGAFCTRRWEAKGGATTEILQSIGFLGSLTYFYRIFDLPITTFRIPTRLIASLFIASQVYAVLGSVGATWWGDLYEYKTLGLYRGILIHNMEAMDGLTANKRLIYNNSSILKAVKREQI
jgi:hypothetical protein